VKRTPSSAEPATSPTVFVLSGGGNQGVSQVGMLRALLERDIVPDVVVGCSAGALNGAGIAYDPTLAGVDRLEELWQSIETGDIFPGGKLSRAWNLVRREPSLFSPDRLQTMLERAIPAVSFADLAVTFRVVACDLITGEEVVLCRGPLIPALMASAALPGIFPPVQHAGHTLVDGGVVNSVPISHAVAGAAARIYVLNVAGGGRPAEIAPSSPLDVVMRSFSIARSQRFRLEMEHLRTDAKLVVLPRPVDDRELYDFSGAADLIAEAHRIASEVLDRDESIDLTARRFEEPVETEPRWARRLRLPLPRARSTVRP